MSTIVTNVKERLRSRSRHRRRTVESSMDETRPQVPSVAISGWQQTNGYDLPKTLRHQALAEPHTEDERVLTPTTITDNKQLPALPQGQGLGLNPNMLARSLGNSPTSRNFPQTAATDSHQAVPDRYSSLPKEDRPPPSDGPSHGHRRVVSNPVSNGYVARSAAKYEQLPSRPKSRHIPIASTSPELGQYEAEVAARESSESSEGSREFATPGGSPTKEYARRFPLRKDSLENGESARGRLPAHRTGKSQDLAPEDPSPLVPRHRNKEHKQDTVIKRKAIAVPDNVHIPDNFQLESYKRTDVETDWLPAVTQEVIHRQQTEIIQKQITRDIHVHHYYEYFQPIKVVEVLPAKHWFLDPITGKKMEIPEPTGWKMPANMRPNRPDTSSVTKKTRHYLVNDEHPHGKLEPGSEPYDEIGNRRMSTISNGSATAAPAA